MPAPLKRLFASGLIPLAVLIALVLYTHSGPKVAPSVSLTTLTGQHLDPAGLRGKVVLVNFFATSCTFCVAEMPRVTRTFDHYRDQGFDVIAIAMQYDPPSYVLDYSQSRALPFPVALDTQGEAARKFGGIDATPTSFLIDRHGKVIGEYVGTLDFATLDRDIERALAA